MNKRFSSRFDSFEDWRRQAGDTVYAKEIERLHRLHPNATLDQLRRHPKKDDGL
jgi:hypothetical protein